MKQNTASVSCMRISMEVKPSIAIRSDPPRVSSLGFNGFPYACWNTCYQIVKWGAMWKKAEDYILSVILSTAAAIMSIKNFENSFKNYHQRMGIVLYAWSALLHLPVGCAHPDLQH
ncbi:hypothetical protein RJ640_017741 [Escallonia rubra]|uniref:Uncharacterized protein n=1 Tax=Escallonia rubra TaxID=112253 RepID=A0AA88R975_9ASTE|nr:hypothetical protein RJ640_017741 [Escallonia rubra]